MFYEKEKFNQGQEITIQYFWVVQCARKQHNAWGDTFAKISRRDKNKNVIYISSDIILTV